MTVELSPRAEADIIRQFRYYFVDQGKPYLRAMNSNYPQVITATELVILGVAMMLIRRVS